MELKKIEYEKVFTPTNFNGFYLIFISTMFFVLNEK